MVLITINYHNTNAEANHLINIAKLIHVITLR